MRSAHPATLRAALRVGAVLLLIGVLVAAYSTTLPAYHSGQSMSSVLASVTERDSAAYHRAIQQAQTARFMLQDHGISIALIGVVLMALGLPRGIPAPRSPLGFIALALLIPALSTWGAMFGLFQDLERDQVPPWADSVGIPLAGLPVWFTITLIWTLAHLAALQGVRRSRTTLSLRALRRGNVWLVLVTALTGALLALALKDGAYWDAVSLVLWIYFYWAIASVRAAGSQQIRLK